LQPFDADAFKSRSIGYAIIEPEEPDDESSCGARDPLSIPAVPTPDPYWTLVQWFRPAASW
jgi:hypothetical protein